VTAPSKSNPTHRQPNREHDDVRPAPLDTPAFRKLLAEESKLPTALIKDRNISVD
jgi:hypothetical protein